MKIKAIIRSDLVSNTWQRAWSSIPKIVTQTLDWEPRSNYYLRVINRQSRFLSSGSSQLCSKTNKQPRCEACCVERMLCFFFSSEIFLNSKQRLTNPPERRIEWKSKCSMKSLETIAIKSCKWSVESDTLIQPKLSDVFAPNRSLVIFLFRLSEFAREKPVIKRRSCCVRDAMGKVGLGLLSALTLLLHGSDGLPATRRHSDESRK